MENIFDAIIAFCDGIARRILIAGLAAVAIVDIAIGNYGPVVLAVAGLLYTLVGHPLIFRKRR